MNNPNSKSQSPYETEKLIFAAYMVAAGKAELIGTYPLDKGKNVVFILSNAPSSDDVTAFFTGSAFVSALRFAETINTLKSVAYEVLRCSGSIE